MTKMAKQDKNIKNFPNLRFPGLNSEENNYKKHLFRDIFHFSTGKNIKQDEASPEFAIPCVRYGELYYMYSEVITEVVNKTNLDESELLLSDGDEILLPSAGEDPLDIGSASALIIKNVAIGRTINILKPIVKNIYSQVFVAYYINGKLRRKISTLAKGSSISNVYNSDLKTLEIILPKISEQHKVASFLLFIDSRIQTQKKTIEKLETSMKGFREKIFSQELRFKDGNGNYFFAWSIDKLTNLCEIKKGEQLNKDELNDKELYPCLNGGINFSGFTHKYNSEENTITISEGGNSCGFINFMTTKFWLGGHCYKIIFQGNFVDKYFYHLLKFNEKHIMNLRVGSGLPNIQQKDLKNIDLLVTHENTEQTKIANFLSSIDEKIETEKKILQKYELQKKYLLSNLFI